MYMYISIYMCIHVYICVYIYMNIYIYIFTNRCFCAITFLICMRLVTHLALKASPCRLRGKFFAPKLPAQVQRPSLGSSVLYFEMPIFI